MTRPGHNSSQVFSKVYLGDANRILCKDVLKQHSNATCNLTHKVTKISHVKLDIRKPFNNQSPANLRKPSSSVTKLSHLKACNSAHQKLHHDRGVDTNNVSANHLRYKTNQL